MAAKLKDYLIFLLIKSQCNKVGRLVGQRNRPPRTGGPVSVWWDGVIVLMDACETRGISWHRQTGLWHAELLYTLVTETLGTGHGNKTSWRQDIAHGSKTSARGLIFYINILILEGLAWKFSLLWVIVFQRNLPTCVIINWCWIHPRSHALSFKWFIFYSDPQNR